VGILATGGYACVSRVNPDPDKPEKLNIEYSIENIQSLEDGENIPILRFRRIAQNA